MTRYSIGTDRALILVGNPFVSGAVRAETLEDIMAVADGPAMPVPEGLRWRAPRIPGELMRRVIGTAGALPFEICFQLLHNLQTREWDVHLGHQLGTATFVTSADDREDLKGFMKVGSIHSHPNMGAFWSGTDMRANWENYGLHMVVGTSCGKANSIRITYFAPPRVMQDMSMEEVIDVGDGLELGDCRPYDPWVTQLLGWRRESDRQTNGTKSHKRTSKQEKAQ